MAKRENMGVNIPGQTISGVVTGQGRSWAVDTIRGSTWFGPYQPLQPNAQNPDQGVIGRQFDYPVGFNLRIEPRQEESISFGQLRALADGYDLLRLVIETRKDQIAAFDWEIVPMDKKAKTDKFATEISTASQFLERPSLEHDWATWLRMSLEDVFVLDAWAIYPRANRGGKIASLDLVDGATLKRVIDETGRTPLPPSPAYQQVLHGIPAVDYTTDELIYFARNARTNRIYGYSPVEQIITTINIAIRRQISQLQYYTEGNIPEAIVGVDPSWAMSQIKEFQGWVDETLSGDTAKRRKMTFIPGDASKIQFTKESILKDEYDEWLARIVCYSFSLPPTAFTKQMNRGTAEQAADSAKEEGLMPLLMFISKKMNFILHHILQLPTVQFKWKMSQQLDAKTQADIDDIRIKNGSSSIDEVRQQNGEQPLGVGNLIFTPSGPVPIDQFTAAAIAKAKAAAAGPLPAASPLDEPLPMPKQKVAA